jgi:hypothetical protein
MEHRDSIEKFADAMETMLQEKDLTYKRDGWKNLDILYLEHRLIEEVGQYFTTCYRFEPLPSQQDIQRKLIHIANFAMMLREKYQ